MSARLFVLAALIASAPSPSPSPSAVVPVLPSQPLTLRFKPHAPVRYAQTTVQITVELHGGKEPQTTRVETPVVVDHRVEARGDALVVTEHPLTPDGTAPAARTSATLDPRGRFLDAGGAPLPPRAMQLILPEKPLPGLIAIFGQPSFGTVEWSTESPPRPDQPVSLRTDFEVPGTEVAAGRECVVIAWAAKGQAPTKEGKGRFEYWGKGRALFDPIAGIVVSSEVEERVDDVVMPPPLTGLQRVHRETLVRRTLESPRLHR